MGPGLHVPLTGWVTEQAASTSLCLSFVMYEMCTIIALVP